MNIEFPMPLFIDFVCVIDQKSFSVTDNNTH
jgi:hypothetical protein